MKNLARGAGLAGVLVMIAGPALAGPVTWTLNGVTFTDGGTASGTFVYDADTNTYSNINVVTTAGTDLPGETYTQVGGVDGTTVFMDGTRALGLLPATGPAIGATNFNLRFPEALTNAGGSLTLETALSVTSEITCQDAPCSTIDALAPLRSATAGSVSAPVPVPTLGEWSLILFSLGLAGVAGLAAIRGATLPGRLA